MSSTIFRGLISGRRRFCSAAAAPCLMLPHHFMAGGRDMVYSFYSPLNKELVSFNNRGGEREARLMRDEETKLVGSSHGWLATYSSRNRGVCLSNPLSGRRIDLPPLAGEPFHGEQAPEKLIMSGPPDHEDCRAVVILDSGSEVAFCCPGSGGWTPLNKWRLHDAFNRVINGFTPTHSDLLGSFRFYTDFVYSSSRSCFVALLFETRLFSFDDRWEVEHWDISDPTCPRVHRVDRLDWLEDNPMTVLSMYIVPEEESAQLYLVARGITKEGSNSGEGFQFHYKVYRIQDGGRLEFCSSLDGLAMFVGMNPVASRFSPQLKHNCIYFADPGFDIFHGQYIEIFDYQNKTSSPLYFPKRHQNTQIPITWITPTFA